MEVNSIIRLFKITNPPKIDTRKPINQLASDKFERSASFTGRGFINRRDMANCGAIIYGRLKNIAANSTVDSISNFYSRSFLRKITPDLADKFGAVDPKTNVSIVETLVNRGDDLKPLIDNLPYLNGRHNSTLKDLDPKELAYLFSAHEPNGNKTMADIVNYLTTKKQEVSANEYDQLLTDVISGVKKHTFDLIKPEKPLQEALQVKFDGVFDLIKNNPNQNAVAKNLEYLKSVGQKHIFANDLTSEEFAFFLTTDINKIKAKYPNSEFMRILNRVKDILPEDMYKQYLTDAAGGKRSSDLVVKAITDSPRQRSPYNKYTNDEWINHLLKVHNE